ncbi:MAG: AraC family transcriptional regulator [Lentisphaeria bacterium]|nr:AraC family transcriptional regulator [Lentisphaeria bacterium]
MKALKKEQLLWYKRFVVLRPVPGLLCPALIAFAHADSIKYQNPGAKRSKRWKHTLVFQYTLSGRGVFERDGVRHDLTPGRAFFCNVSDDRLTYYYPDDTTEPWEFLYVTIIDTIGWIAPVNQSFGYIFDIDPSEPQIQHLLAYGDVAETSIQIDAGAAHVFASTLIGMLVDQAQCEARHRGAALRIVKRGLDTIEAMIGKPLNAKMLAEQIGVSQEHLNRIFRDELGRTPYQCIADAKMHRACELLKNTDQTIANVAEQVGYGPDSHFARLFKRVIGVTPSRYRGGASMPVNRWHC